MRQILTAGAEKSKGDTYSHHVLFLLKSGSHDVEIEIADANDDLTKDASWRKTGVILEASGIQARVVFTAPGAAYRVRVDANAGWDCVVAVDRINEQTESAHPGLS